MGSKWRLFCVTLSEESKKCMRFYWRGDLYQFLCLFFGLAPTVIKLLKTSIAFLRRISTLLTIYHDDMLFNGRTAEEILKSQYLNQYQSSQFSISQLKKVLGHAIYAILPARLNCRSIKFSLGGKRAHFPEIKKIDQILHYKPLW